MSRRIGRWAAAVAVASCAVLLAGVTPAASARAGPVSSSGWASGVGTRAALGNPACDAETGRLQYAARYRPPCVREWVDGADNGGATAFGVTATAIKVVVLVPPESQPVTVGLPQALPVNQATRQTGTFADAARDASAVFDHAGFATWGRHVDFAFVVGTGSDDAAQAADAAAVIAQRPFAVLVPVAAAAGGIGGPVFERTVADAKIVVVGYPMTKDAVDQAPYRWSAATGDDRAQVQLAAEFVGRELAGHPAAHAGTPVLQATARVFGVVYPTGSTGLEIERFRRVVERTAGTSVRIVTSGFDPTLATSDPERLYQEVLPESVDRFRAQGVTTIVPFADSAAINALMKAATNLDFAPEWISTTTTGGGPVVASRSWDQEQASRFFGLQSGTVPTLAPLTTQPLQGFQWYWGLSLGTSMASVTASLELLRTGIHLAGPQLTPSTFSSGMCDMGAVGGAADDTQSSMRAPCRAAGLPWYVHHSASLDASLGWWDATATYTTTAGQTVGPGAWRFVDAGRRYRNGTFPRMVRPFFTESKAILAFDAPRRRDIPPTYPCVGCPAGTSTTQPVAVTPAPLADTPLAAAVASGAALPEDFADPFVFFDQGYYYAYSTGGSRGMVQAARSRDLSHWTWLGAALTAVPRWATGRTIWAPSVARLDGHMVMYYAARDRASGQWCVSYAVAAAPNAIFVDTTVAPLVCQTDRGGSIDPHAFIDRDGTPYLLWTTQVAPGSGVGALVGAPLTADGTALAGLPRTLLTAAAGWEGDIIENPALTLGADGYTLLYSGNSWDSDRYAVGVARCTGPLGPCVRTSNAPALASTGSVLGPGGAVVVTAPDGARSLVFAAWAAPRVGYRAGGARNLYVRPLTSLGLSPS